MWLSYFSYELETRAIQLFQRGTKFDVINPTWMQLIPCKAMLCILGAQSVGSQCRDTQLCCVNLGPAQTLPHPSWLRPSRSFCVLDSEDMCYGMQTVQAHTTRTGHILNRSFLIPVGIQSE